MEVCFRGTDVLTKCVTDRGNDSHHTTQHPTDFSYKSYVMNQK